MPADKPAATVHGTGSRKPLCKGPVDSDGYHCICSNYHEHNGKCRYHNQVFHNIPTPPASPTVTLEKEIEYMVTRRSGIKPTDYEKGYEAGLRDALALLRAAERHQP